jgi:uridine kinase
MNAATIEKLTNQIREWQVGHPKLVVGLEGYSGAGKTTLANKLADILPAVVVHMDDFQVSDDARRKLENSDTPNPDVFVEKYRFDLLKDLVRKYKSGAESAKYELYDTDKETFFEKEFVFDSPLLVVDGIWLSDQNRLPHVFDKIVFLATNHETADNRRREREDTTVQEETDPDSPAKQYKLAHDAYMKKYQPDKRADLVIENR